MQNLRLGAWGVTAGILAIASCESPADLSAECTAQMAGVWEGPASGSTLWLNLRASSTCCGCHLEGSWRWASTGGMVLGSMDRSSTQNSVLIELNPLESTCLLSDGIEGPRLIGVVGDRSIDGTLSGGWRRLPESLDCSDPSDTIIAFDTTAVTLVRGS